MTDGTNPTSPAGGASAAGQQNPNPAQEALGKYRARLAAFPMATPWGSAGWPPMPPSAMMPAAHAQGMQPHPLGSLSLRLGSTLRLGIDLLNATLASATNALSGIGASERSDCGCGGDCGCHRDCCREMAMDCCSPGAHGCGGCGCG